MKTIQLKLSTLSLLFLAGFAFTSCGNKDDKPDKDGASYEESKFTEDGNNSYRITIAGTGYSYAW